MEKETLKSLVSSTPGPKVDPLLRLKEKNEELSFLAILSSFAKSVGFFNPFLEHLTLPMKEVGYSTIDKIATLFSSIIVGCSHIKDINHKLTPYPSAAEADVLSTELQARIIKRRFLASQVQPIYKKFLLL